MLFQGLLCVLKYFNNLKNTSQASYMDITSILNEIVTLCVDDRIRLVQAIWDSVIAAEQASPELIDSQKREFDSRIIDSLANPEDTLTWQDIVFLILLLIIRKHPKKY
jgi:putative addiction module component (TIGR02574 family)